jgi:hypothetical protein
MRVRVAAYAAPLTRRTAFAGLSPQGGARRTAFSERSPDCPGATPAPLRRQQAAHIRWITEGRAQAGLGTEIGLDPGEASSILCQPQSIGNARDAAGKLYEWRDATIVSTLVAAREDLRVS